MDSQFYGTGQKKAFIKFAEEIINNYKNEKKALQTIDKVKTIYDPRREWENFDFPIEISKLSFDKNLHGLSESCVIRIWRDDSFKLRGRIHGYTLNAKSLSETR